MDHSIELRHLRYFVAVAEELHFGRASQRLHLAQPPLSQQIRKLEEYIGYRLFLRTSRSVRLTSAGEALLQRARHTLEKVQRDVAEVRSIGNGDVGSLHIGFIGSGMLTTLPAIFKSYREAYPNVLLHLHESFTSQVMQGLANGTLDVGILRDGDPDDSLISTRIFSEPFVAVLPAHHPYAGKSSLSAAALRDEPFVYYPQTAGPRAFERPLKICEQHGFRPRIVQEASHWLTILSLVGSGFGVSIAPACVRRLALPEVVCLPLENTRALSHIELVSKVSETRPLVARFAELAKSTQRARPQKT